MITVETAAQIWTCYREIAAGKKLLEDAEKQLHSEPKEDPFPRDPFGRKRGLQLGVPSGENSHRLFDVPPRLALSVIRAHIAEQERQLVVANEAARIELLEAKEGA
jgi:hypothetical protein